MPPRDAFRALQDMEGKKREKAERMRFGRFFYRFPNGESGADVYDRITNFQVSCLWCTRLCIRIAIQFGLCLLPGTLVLATPHGSDDSSLHRHSKFKVMFNVRRTTWSATSTPGGSRPTARWCW